MKTSEAMKLVAVLKGAYPRQPTDEGTAEVYLAFLADLDYEAANDAIRRLIQTSRFFPTIAEIRGEVAELACGLPSVTEATALVLERHRLSDDELAANPLPDAVRKAYRMVGGSWAFRTSENPVALRAQFRDAYAQLRADAVQRIQQAPALAAPERRAELAAGEVVRLPDLKVVPS